VNGRREEERREDDIISYLKRSANVFLGFGVSVLGVGLCGFGIEIGIGERREKGKGRVGVRSEWE
jgi:hypothetical protein